MKKIFWTIIFRIVFKKVQYETYSGEGRCVRCDAGHDSIITKFGCVKFFCPCKDNQQLKFRIK